MSKKKTVEIRDRIKELRRVPAKELIPNEKNWRKHPQGQRDAMEGILVQVGYADAVLARETDEGLVLVDGHLRAETTPDMVIPVLVLDVSESEADLILATHDPLAGMAGVDQVLLNELLASVETESQAVADMLTELAEDNEIIPSEEKPEVDIEPTFQIIVDCNDEDEQRELFDQLNGEGRKCRVLTL